MKLLTIDSRDHAGRPGVLLDDSHILDLGAAPDTLSESHWVPHSVVSVLAAGGDGLDRLQTLVRKVEALSAADRDRLIEDGVVLPFATTALLAPVRRPGLILVADPDRQTEFIKSPNTAVGNAVSIDIPTWLEATLVAHIMLAVVIDRPLFRGSTAEAEQAVAAYTLLVDLSCPAPGEDATAREWQTWLESKQFPGACPIGPALVTTDSLIDASSSIMAVEVNGVQVADRPAVSDHALIADCLARISNRYALRAGDLVGISSRESGLSVPLRVGDRVSIKLNDSMELSFAIQMR